MTTYLATTSAAPTASAIEATLAWPPPRHTVIALFARRSAAIAARDLTRRLGATGCTILRGEALLSAGDGSGTSLPRRLAGLLSDESALLRHVLAAAGDGVDALVVGARDDRSLACALHQVDGLLLFRAGAWTHELVTPRRS